MTSWLEIPRDLPRRSTWIAPVVVGSGLLFLLILHLLAAGTDQMAVNVASPPAGETGIAD